VFIVPMMSRFARPPNSSPECGSVTLTPKAHGVNLVGRAQPRKLSGLDRRDQLTEAESDETPHAVFPQQTFEMFPRLISSITSADVCAGSCCARRHNRLNIRVGTEPAGNLDRLTQATGLGGL
jgi:hypothetical protein